MGDSRITLQQNIALFDGLWPHNATQKKSGSYLTRSAYYIFVAGELLCANRPACMNFAGSNTNFSTHPKLTPISELRRRIMQQDRTIKIMQKRLGSFLVLSNY
jgi:hypothetical protein